MKRSVIILLIISFLTSYSLMAQPKDTVVEKRLDRMEKILEKLPKISGMVNVQMKTTFGEHYEGKVSNSFEVRRARLSLQGDLTKWFDYRLQVELASSPKVLDAYFRAKIKSWFNVQVGEFKIPFTLENPYSPKDLMFIDNAMVISKLCQYDDVMGIKANGRDIGVMLYGGFWKKRGFNTLEYEIGVFNGNGINVKDNNNGKDLIGKISVYPIKNFTISSSFHINVSDNSERETNTLVPKRNRFSAGLRYDDKKWFAMSEYVYGNTRLSDPENTSDKYQHGTYAIFGYTFLGKLTPLFRYELYQDITTTVNYSFGLNYLVNKHIRLMLNYTMENYYGETLSNPIFGHQINLMMMAMF